MGGDEEGNDHICKCVRMRGIVNHLDTYNPSCARRSNDEAHFAVAVLDSPVHCFSVDYRECRAGKGQQCCENLNISATGGPVDKK